MILGVPWPEFIYLASIFVVACWCLRNDFRPGGMFSSVPVPEDELAELFALPLPEGVDEFDVMRTLDWIEAL